MLELEGDGPPARPAARLGRLGRHLAPLLDRLGRARPPRDRRRPARASATADAAATTSAMLPAARRLRRRARARVAAEGGGRSSWPATRSAACVALRLAERERPAARRGRAGRARRPGHAALVRRSSSATRSCARCSRCRCRSRCRCSCATRSARSTGSSRSHAPAPPSRESSTRSPATTATARASPRCLATGARLLPELHDSPFRFERVALPGAAHLGRPRPDGHPRGADRLVAALPHTQLELLEGVGHCPQLEAPERLLELLLRVPRAPSRVTR